ncbi:hypothetical protein C8J57DRAFT_1387837, partial [Mycena rebaudengoi]
TNLLKLSTRTLVFLMHPAASKSRSPRRLRLPPHAGLPPYRPNDCPAFGARSELLSDPQLFGPRNLYALRAMHPTETVTVPSRLSSASGGCGPLFLCAAYPYLYSLACITGCRATAVTDT